jgi:predicted DNA-binding antitoxin AbrB/MazE fold protein
MLNGERVSIIIKGKQIANELVKSKKALKDIFNKLVAEQTLFQSLVGC